ncbi:MAG TPA: hypothetical protein VM050_05250 [Patescibacteria group bacterium]|nr:hypothetical protein [Patescibacteria group bacterium]
MRKTAAFALGVLLVLTLGYVVLHPSYMLVANWLGPVTGSSLLTVLTIIYLLMGDPLKFVALAVLWASVSFLGGLIVRRRVGAVLTMMLVFTFLLPVLLANAYGAYLNVSELAGMEQENPLELLPPLPSGLSIAQLAEAPIVGKVFETVLGMFQSGEMADPYSMMTGLAIQVGVGVLEKLLIIILATLIGVEVGVRIEPMFGPAFGSLKTMMSGGISPGASGTKVGATSLAWIFLLASSLLFSTPVVYASEGFYTENIGAMIDTLGRAYVGDMFVESEAIIDIDWGGEEAEGLIAAVVISQDGVKEILMTIPGFPEEFTSFITLLPPTMMVAVYVDASPEEASSRAEVVSSAFSDMLGADFSELLAFEPPPEMLSGPEGMQIPEFTLVIHQSTAELPDVAGSFLDKFSEHGGLAAIFDDVLSEGSFLPGAGEDACDIAALVSGFIDMETIGSMLPLDELPENVTETLPFDFTKPISFSGGVAYWEQGFETGAEGQSLDLLKLLGVDESVSFSEDSDMSIVLLAAPNGTDLGGKTVPNVKITTSLPPDDPKLEFIYGMLESMGLINLTEPGEEFSIPEDVFNIEDVLSPEAFKIGVEGVTLPLKVQVTKEYNPKSSNKDLIDVTVTVRNEDFDTMTDVHLDDSSSLMGYPASSEIVSGYTSMDWGAIGPGESRSLTYTVGLSGVGIYTLSSAAVSYNSEGELFTSSSNDVELAVSQPNPLSFTSMSLGATWTASVTLLDMFTDGSGSTILLGASAVLLALLAFLEYRNLRAWMRT